MFYPVPYAQAALLFSANYDVARTLRSETWAVHLWNQVVANSGLVIERGSPLDRLFSTGTLFDESHLADSTG